MSLAAVIGMNARKIRTNNGVTLEALAAEARNLGLKWSTARVVDLERGKLNPTLPMLIALALALGRTTRGDVRLPDLVGYDGPVEVTDKVTAPGSDLKSALNGEPVRLWGRTLAAVAKTAEQYPASWTFQDALAHESYGLGDERAARKLGWDKEKMITKSLQLWGRSLSTERDARAGENSTAQGRGQISRTLITELRAADNGDD
ncbi:conserved hypothetical protein [Arthrobacter sp. 9AX]|uniref:helix-turn-helix domain-containing protein n=1 Tax=Arthrobacter sp. 9AX TaxID=2653131 RepID=UPI0012F255F3|nr:helix-turn-helix transcriptional regulator [Arthrobacter sp. 9AX]VXC38778.1 conserved hypothetical protein [Arthrobacter sp. 9AX]